MPRLPDIPGKDLITGTGHRAGKVAAASGLAVIAIGGYLVRRLVRRGGAERAGASAEPIAPAPAAPPTAEEPSTTTGTEAPPQPEAEPGNIALDKEPHHALNNPVGDPDPTEWPDPYEKRDDPRDPADPDGEPFGEEPHPATGAESTSEPHPGEDREAGDRAEPPKRDKLDD
jgi:hypothetical protein